MGVISGGRQEREKKRAVRAYDGQLRKGQDADPCVVLLCVSCTTSVICCVCYGESGLCGDGNERVRWTWVCFWAGLGVCQRDAVGRGLFDL